MRANVADVQGGNRLAPAASSAIAAGMGDFVAGLKAWRLWRLLGWNDILQRYRRSALGPFWITLSMAIFIVMLGFLYGRLFKLNVVDYIPYVAAGLITWGFISGAALECCAAFTENGGIIKQLSLPFSLYVFRAVWRSLIVFFHTAVLMIPIAMILGIHVSVAVLLVVPGLALICINQIWVGIVVAVLSTRYRDVVQLVATAVQIGMFATPIMWPVSSLHGAEIVADVNPLYHLIELVRAPLLGAFPRPLSWFYVLVMCVVGYGIAIALLGRARRRIVYWL